MIPTKIVETRHGPVRGIRSASGGWAFKGVPFGEDTSGALRFAPPRAAASWSEVRDASRFGSYCPQVDANLPAMDAHSLSDLPAAPGEDCLNVNVWTPQCGDGITRPVMVWLHPGAFSIGTTAHPIIDGALLSNYGDVVVVSIGHRLGLLGYLLLDEPGDKSSGGTANAGLLDIVLGLQWIRDNIEAFGGDPGNVTLFGDSGGGRKISVLMAVPAAAGLFHRAIIQSGAHPRCIGRETATAFARAYLECLGLGHPRDMLMLTASELCVRAAAFASDWHDPTGLVLPGRASWILSPVVDGIVLPTDPWGEKAPEVSGDIPMLIGTTGDEAALHMAREPEAGQLSEDQLLARCRLVLGPDADAIVAAHRAARPDAEPWHLLVAISGEDRRVMSIEMAEQRAGQGLAPVFMYRLDWKSDQGLYGASHMIDVPLVFRTHGLTPLTATKSDRHLMSDIICDAWLAFARCGDPACPSIGLWPAYDMERRATMLLDVKPHLGFDPLGEARIAWGPGRHSMPWEASAFSGLRRSR